MIQSGLLYHTCDKIFYIVTYDNVIPVNGDLELPEVTEKFTQLNSEIIPDIKRNNPLLQTRKLAFSDGSEGYFLYNQSGDTICETIGIESSKNIYEVNLFDGALYSAFCKRESGSIDIAISLLRGEGMFLLLTEEKFNVPAKPIWEKIYEITDIQSRISRVYKLDFDNGVCNIYPDNEWQNGYVK